jgi:hypothetical protein
VSWSISCSIGSGVDRLHHFIFTLSHFSHRLMGTLVTTSFVWMFRSAPGIRTCCRSSISWACFFELGSGNAEVSLKSSNCRRIFEVV